MRLPTDILKEEHRVILRVLAVLEKMIQRAKADRHLDPPSARQAVEFFRNFADRCHHGKEEAHLFPAMEAKGFSREFGPTGVMLAEHEQGRSHVRAMAEAVERLETAAEDALDQFVQHASAFIPLLRAHIDKEDHCLFAMADQAFTEDDHQRLLQKFEQVEHEEIGHDVHQRYLEVADQLCARYDVATPDGSAASTGGCCGH